MPVKVENDLHWRILYDEQEQRTFRTITDTIEFLHRALQTQGYGLMESRQIVDKLKEAATAYAKADVFWKEWKAEGKAYREERAREMGPAC